MQLRHLSLCAAIAIGCRGPESPRAAIPIPTPLFEASSYAIVQESPPWSLTTADGSGLALTRVEATAVLHGPLAFTELHLYFHNPEDRMREGRFEIALPPRAAISRFAMEGPGGWMEAEVVEKLRARETYETFLHRRQDPALLEKTAGNQFTARVFPISPRADKHLVIGFSQELPGERYVLPLRGLPKIGEIDVRLHTIDADGRATEHSLSERAWRPDRDFVSPSRAPGAAAAGGLVVAPVVARARGVAPAADPPAGITLLVDTSASRSLGFGRTIRTARDVIEALGDRHGAALSVEVYAYDQTTQRIFRGHPGAWSDAHERALAVRGAAGASDLGQAFAALAWQQPRPRVVLLTDGVVTAGTDGAALAAAAARLPGVERFDVLLTGGIRDPELAETIARAGARPGAVIDLERGVDDAVAALGERVLSDVEIEVPGATWSYPKVIPTARDGERVLVYARLRARAKELAVRVNGHRQRVRISDGSPVLLERAAAAAEIGELEARLAAAPGDAKLRAEIVKRSVASRVLSSQTSLLVLESEADYARFRIDRRALADIIEVAPGGTLRVRAPAPSSLAGSQQVARAIGPAERPRTSELVEPVAPAAAAAPAATVARAESLDAAAAERGEVIEIEGRAPVVTRTNTSSPVTVVIDTSHLMPPPRISTESVIVYGSSYRRCDTPMATELARHYRKFGVLHSCEDEVDYKDVVEDKDEDVIEDEPDVWPPPDSLPALSGELGAIMRDPRSDAALAMARAWHLKEPGNVLALIGMGEVFEARGQLESAARMYGSIIDLFPGRADLRRYAGQRLERIGNAARALAVDTYRRAVADRPDHLTGHRLLAYALLRAGQHAEALAAIFAGLDRSYPSGRFAGGDRVLVEDAGLIAAAYAAAVPEQRAAITAALAQRGLEIPSAPSTRFVLYWETDANDVDLHVQDHDKQRAFAGRPELPSGGRLMHNVTTGYGPEAFVIDGKAKGGPYHLSLTYASQGAMGYGMGLVQIIHHDGSGKLSFDDRPYVIMSSGAYADLGRY